MTKEEILHIANRRGKSCLDLIYEVYKELESRSCENCKHYQPITRNNTLFKRCFYLGTVGDIGFCGRWEKKDDR